MLLLTARGDVLLPHDVKLYLSPQKQNATLQLSRLKCPLPTVPQRSRQNPEKTGRWPPGALTWFGCTQLSAVPALTDQYTLALGWPPAAKLS